jgi:hypothetical protein
VSKATKSVVRENGNLVAERKERESIMSAYAQKLESARKLFEQHNTGIEDESKQLNFDIFVSNLKAEGGTSEEGLSECSFEDIAEFGTTAGCKFPRLLAKQIAKIFRAKPAKTKVITEKKALLMNTRELLQAYNPKEDDAVSLRLRLVSKSMTCIVFNEDGTVNVDASVVCIEDIKEDYEPRTVFIGADGVPQKVHRVGRRPASTLAENPLLPDRPLRGATETCDQTHRSWEKVPHKVRVLLRLALTTGELSIDQVGRIHDTLDLLIGKSEEDMVSITSQRFHKAALLYNDKKLEGTLPTLKIVRNGSTKARKQDPFFKSQGHKRF